MGSISQDAPASSIDSIAGEAFEGEFTRGVNDPYPIELINIELLREGSPLWTYLEALDAASVAADAFSVPLPALIDRAAAYSWRVRLRDVKGTWTDWTGAVSFSLGSSGPVLSAISPPDGTSMEVLNGVYFSADYEDSDGSPVDKVFVQMHGTAAAPTATNGQLTWPDDDELASPYVFRVHWNTDGDNPHIGDLGSPLAGLIAYNGSVGDRTGFTVSGFGTLSVHCRVNAAMVVTGTVTFTLTIRVNGITVATATDVSSGGLRFVAPVGLINDSIDVEDGDVVEARFASSYTTGGLVIPAGSGDPSNVFNVSGTLYGDAVDSETIIWSTEGEPRSRPRDTGRVGSRYSGRTLDAGDYTWTIQARNKRGALSNILTGGITLTKGWEPSPGSADELTGVAWP